MFIILFIFITGGTEPSAHSFGLSASINNKQKYPPFDIKFTQSHHIILSSCVIVNHHKISCYS